MDAILDAGASGLQYFAVFLPRAALVADGTGTGELSATPEQVEARYFEQRGIDLTALDADIEAIGRITCSLDRTFDDQTRAVRALPEAWQGPDAELACRHLSGNLERADRLRSSAHDVRTALVVAERELREVVTRKSEWVRDRDASQLGGRTVAEIDTMLGTSGYLSGGASAGVGPFEESCREWLAGVFLPHVRDTLREFTALCDATETAVDDIYCTLARVFAQIDDSACPAPGTLAVDCRTRTPVATAQCSAAPVQASAATAATPAPAPTSVTAVPSATPATALTPVTAESSLSGLERPPVQPGATLHGSLALDGAVRAVGAVVGMVADVALDIVDGLVRVAAESTLSGGSLDLESERGCDCDCACDCARPAEAAPAPEAPATEPPPAPEPAPAPEPSVTPVPDCPEDEAPVVDEPVEQPAPQAPPVEEAPADYCAPAPEPAAGSEVGSTGAPAAHSVVGAPPGSPRRRAEEPAIAEMGSQPLPGEETGAVLAEAGPL
ncbi:hypothetical protein [Rhodococcus sp. W8901]|uniref:hypothetical protein n=1 Tax=Rhodococcus sp. W8901 TaxID=2742603 RepID=UPI00158242C0|nr:hypothetical protein [Rhodococcus sp. W8901]QKT12733.1 hypothetical protein HUN07_20300 [Rhodococcus sp. W8901]